NMAAVVAQTARKNASRVQTDTLTRLSTGLRVNSARDDAAGLAVGARFGSTIGTSSRLIQDLSNGISLAQVAQGGLQQMTGLLQRMRELAVQAAGGSHFYARFAPPPQPYWCSVRSRRLLSLKKQWSSRAEPGRVVRLWRQSDR
ncbi:MAG: hypothetical protein ACKODU_11325, partial [Limnohabitans sp.]